MENQQIDLAVIYQELNITDQILADYLLPPQKECLELIYYRDNRYCVPLFMDFKAYLAWSKLSDAARQDNIDLEVVSAYRSFYKQYTLVKNKLKKNFSLDEVLYSLALPGYSEHHTARALDITSEKQGLSAEFANSKAFTWLMQNAARFDFYLSYPQNNQYNIIFEPWHWCYHA